MDRRAYLATTGVCSLALATGCLGGADRDSEPTDDQFYNAANVSIADHPVTEPVSFTDSHRCPVCNMQPVDYRTWASQLAHADGTGLFFETPGCLLAYRAVGHSHPTEAPIERIWFTDYGTNELFDAADGFLVRETAVETQDEPMSGSPVPFATRERAAAYVDDAGHLDTDAILTLDDVGDDLARFYRGTRMPDE